MPKGNNKLTKKVGWQHIVGGILVIAILVIAFSITKKADSPTLPTAHDVLERLERPMVATNYDYVTVEEWEDAATAQETINKSQGKDEDQETVMFSVVQDPNNKGTYYFATIDDSNIDEVFVGVYKYTVDSRNWERLYKKTTAVDSLVDLRHGYRVLGLDSDRLVLQETALDFEPDECFEPLIAEPETEMVKGEENVITGSIVTMDLDGPYGKWAEIKIPDEVRSKLEKRQADCKATP
ncbi:hypothetical protein HQ524_00585 [Candidatus Uhrbacteria bacterium]|nr:hypothetical protein [Candidatus Uhrbacteria bacterium]